MAFNPSPKVAAARRIAQEFHADQVVVLMMNHTRGTIESASYGATLGLCNHARRLADVAFDAVQRDLMKQEHV